MDQNVAIPNRSTNKGEADCQVSVYRHASRVVTSELTGMGKRRTRRRSCWKHCMVAMRRGAARRRRERSGLDQAPRRGECWTSIGSRRGADVQMISSGREVTRTKNVTTTDGGRQKSRAASTSTKVDFTQFNPLQLASLSSLSSLPIIV
jgi:hypothetical protein